MDSLVSLAVAIGDSLALSLVVKATIVAAAGLLALRVMRNVRASRKYLVLAWTFVVLGGMPVMALLAAPLALVIRETRVVTAPAPAVPSAMLLSAEPDIAVRSAGEAPAALPTQGRYAISAGELIAVAWAIGFVVCLAPMLRILRRLGLYRRTARPWKESGRVPILQHEKVTAPMTFGLLRPVVLLPNDVSGWPDADVERALVHELEHVRRRDWPVHLFARLVCALYWFHPLVWRAGRHLYLEADRACDDAVVSSGEGDAFADQLVALAGRLSSRAPAAVPSMAGGDLSTRVMAIVNPRQARGRSGVTYGVLAALVAMTCVAVIAPLKAIEKTTVIAAVADRALVPAEPRIGSSAVERVPPRATPLVAPAAARQQDRFEVASVVRVPSTAGDSVPSPGGTSFVAYNVTVQTLVEWAYGIRRSTMAPVESSARPWATTDVVPVWSAPVMEAQFDIRARAPAPADASDPPRGTLGRFHYMVQTLLAERFKLAVRWDRRDRPAYALTSAAAARPASAVRLSDCPGAGPGDAPCGTLTGSVSATGGSLSGRGVTVASIADRLARALGKEVIDRTGGGGLLDIDLRFGMGFQRMSLAEALRDQLGLTLERVVVPGDVLVIAHVEMPTPD